MFFLRPEDLDPFAAPVEALNAQLKTIEERISSETTDPLVSSTEASDEWLLRAAVCYRDLLWESQQSSEVFALYPEINVARFSIEAAYRRNVIIGLK